MILDDIRRELVKAKRERARKRSLGFPEPVLTVYVGFRAQHAYIAARCRLADRILDDVELATFVGHPVEYGGCLGVMVKWQAR